MQVPQTPRPDAVRFADFDLDLQSGEIWKNGSRVLLAEQLFRILALLVRRHGELVTRDDLRHELWAPDTFVDFEHSLNAAIKRLREILGDSATKPTFIETIPRRGYRFIAPVIGLAVTVAPPGNEPFLESPARTVTWFITRVAAVVAAALVVVAAAWMLRPAVPPPITWLTTKLTSIWRQCRSSNLAG